MNLDPAYYRNKDVAIVGGGNAAFEVATSILPEVRSIMIIKRKPLGLTFNTHYVGDLRALNASPIDFYRFSLLVGIIEIKQGITKVEKRRYGNRKKLYLPEINNVQTKRPPLFDHVILCTGWTYNWTFLNHLFPKCKDKYPKIQPNYQSVAYPNLFVIGAASHSVDKGKSSGGFIHGFRYTTKVAYKVMQWKFERIKWSDETYIVSEHLFNHILTRYNEASALYQMFLVLVDIFLIDESKQTYQFIEQYPVMELHRIYSNTGLVVCASCSILLFRFEYYFLYSGVGVNTINEQRVQGTPKNPQYSNFLHPSLYYYKPGYDFMKSAMNHTQNFNFPSQPDAYYSNIEDITTNFYDEKHMIPNILFLKEILNLNVYMSTIDNLVNLLS